MICILINTDQEGMEQEMKIGRQSKIIEFITMNDIETQDELAELLENAGYNVTQATISRDIRELKLTKVAVDGGHQKYVVLKSQETGLTEKYVRVLRDGFVSADMAQNIMVVKTVSGMAMAVAAAIDAMDFEGVVGCIAGDDTIMCAVRTVHATEKVIDKLNKIVNYKEQ